jgi:molecular chaperone DnaJ
VPAGVDTGTRIQLAGEGESGVGGGPAGDLYVEIVVADHPTFVRRGDDLHARIGVPMTAAALGTTLTLQSLDGPQTLEIEAGTQSGDTITLRGVGVTHLRGAGRGDLVVEIEVETPRGLDDEQRRLLAQLAALRGEERPEGRLAQHGTSLFGKLRDVLSGK